MESAGLARTEKKPPTPDAPRFRRALLAWYDAHRRDLPWRRTRDPYAIWVSEIMLQQTQVSRVVEYWRRFLDRFPDIRSLAKAPEGEVLALWSGLGYYRRAKHLHAAARVIVEQFEGEVPSTVQDLRRLPGMGEYTSAAVGSIAFGERAAVVDANVVRVLCRILALRGDPSAGSLRGRIRDEAERLLDPDRPGDHNQAMMELGAVICTPTGPKCLICPVAEFCGALRKGRPDDYPGTARKTETVEVLECAAVVTRRGKVLMAKQPHERGWWDGLWTLPRCPLSKVDDPAECLREVLSERFGLECVFEAKPEEVMYGVTRHRVRMLVYRCNRPKGRLRNGSWGKWFAAKEVEALGVPSPHMKFRVQN